MSTIADILDAAAASDHRTAQGLTCPNVAGVLILGALRLELLAQRIRNGDIGEEQETIEVIPEEAPLTVPVPPVPVPA